MSEPAIPTRRGRPEHLFGDDRPFAQCHAATLAFLGGGAFLAAWFGGAHEKNPDVAIWLSRRAGRRWSPPRRVAKVRGSAHWNPVLFRAPGGRIHLFFKVGDTISAWETWTMTSDDQGATWSEPRALVPGDRGGRGPVKNKPIVLADKSWLAGASLESGGRWDAFVDRSVDGGRTWTASDPVPLNHAAFPGSGVIQPTLWESRPGRVHMLLRSTAGYICRSDSDDSGLTWSPAAPTHLPHNNSGIDLARLADGRLVLAYNPVTSGRTPLSLAVSGDNGETWRRFADLEAGEGEYSYPAILPTRTGVAVAYTWKRQRIAFWQGTVPR